MYGKYIKSIGYSHNLTRTTLILLIDGNSTILTSHFKLIMWLCWISHKLTRDKNETIRYACEAVTTRECIPLPNRRTFDYIRESTATNLADRLYDINKDLCFRLEINCSRGDLVSSMIESDPKIRVLAHCDTVFTALNNPNYLDAFRISSSEGFNV